MFKERTEGETSHLHSQCHRMLVTPGSDSPIGTQLGSRAGKQMKRTDVERSQTAQLNGTTTAANSKEFITTELMPSRQCPRVHVGGPLEEGLTRRTEYLHTPIQLHTMTSYSDLDPGHQQLISAKKAIYLEKYEQALEALSDAVKAGVDVESDMFMRTCNSLIRKGRNSRGLYHETSHIVETLLALGVRLDITSYNILMLNAREAGDQTTTRRIYKLIRQNGIEPNHYSWTILLKTCREANDRGWFRKIYKHIQEQAADRLHDSLITELLMMWYHFGKRSDFTRILRFYEKHHDIRILKDLALVHPKYKCRSDVESNHKPSTRALVIMILSFVRKEQPILAAAEVYRQFQRLLAENHPLIVPLGESTLVYSIFMKAFGRKAGSLKLWPRLLRDMAQDLGPDVINKDTGLSFTGCKPNIIFWNILLNAFARSDQLAAAEKVIELMRQQGFAPDKYSWTSLASGYARKQDIESTVGVLKRMQDNNVAGDEYTVKTLQLIDDRPRLLELMQKLAKEPSVDPSSQNLDDLDDSIETMLDRPGEENYGLEPNDQDYSKEEALRLQN